MKKVNRTMKKSKLLKILNSLSIQEKIEQLTQLTASHISQSIEDRKTGPEKTNSDVSIQQIGSIINSFGAENLIKIQNEYLNKSKNKIPLLFTFDVIHGYYTHYPINLGLSASFDFDLIEDCCSMSAKEATVDGMHLTFSPGVDLCRDSRWGRCAESAGEDVYLNCEFAKSSVKGYQGDLGKYKIAACVKHFGAYGAGEAGLDYNMVDMSKRTLLEYYFRPYKSAIDAGVVSLMTSFNSLNGIPMVANNEMTFKLLRQTWNFNGVVISDWGAFDELLVHGVAEDGEDVVRKCLNSSVDIEMMTTFYSKHLEESIKNNKEYQQKLDEAVLRILELKDKLRLFDNPYKDANIEDSKLILGCREHLDLARKAAEESAVLLKNDNILPFNNIQSIAVIGPYADSKSILGSWTCVDNDKTVDVFQGVKNIFGENRVNLSKGCGFNTINEEQLFSAVETAKKTDAVVLCLGCDPNDSGEGCSKTELDLPECQYELLNKILSVNKNVAVVLFVDRGMTIERLDKLAPAILNVWYPGTEGGNAIANLIFGKSNPCGKLPISFPRRVGQCPIYYSKYRTGRPRANDNLRCEYQSAYIDCANSPLYPFGYGLSYSKFYYSKPTVSNSVIKKGNKIIVSVNVKNVSLVDGKEIVQLYIQDEVCSCVRPIKELKKHKKIFLRAGESMSVEFEVGEESLSFFNKDLVETVEEGYFKIFVGEDSKCERCVRIKYKN